jgi:hypothetical protein
LILEDTQKSQKTACDTDLLHWSHQRSKWTRNWKYERILFKCNRIVHD